MTAYRIQAYADVKDDLLQIPEPMRSRVRQKINELGEDPRPPGVVKMSGYANAYRVRVGKYRIVYFIHDKQLQILIVTATTRGKAYEIFKRRLGK